MDATLKNMSALPTTAWPDNEEIAKAAGAKTKLSTTFAAEIDKAAQQQLGEEIANSVSESYGQESLFERAAPDIRTPAGTLTNNAKVLMHLVQFGALSSELDSQKLRNALTALVAASEISAQKAQAMTDALDELNKEYDGYMAELESAVTAETAAEGAVQSAAERVAVAKKQLATLLDSLGAASADDPAIADNPEVAKAVEQLQLAEQALQNAHKTHDAAKTLVLTLRDKAQVVLNSINAKTREINELVENAPSSNSNISTQSQAEQALNRTAMMILLISTFIEKMDESSAEKLKNDLKLNRAQLQARQNEMTKKSQEYEEQVRKAEDLQKTMGCIGKILGGIVTVIGAATSIFGGAGLGLMAFGLALTAGDLLMEKLTGESLTSTILNPFMEHVITPLMDALGPLIEKIFDYSGLGLLLNAIDKATGANMMDTIHGVVKAAVAIAAIVALAMVAKSVAKFLIEKMTKAMSSAIMKTIKDQIQKVMQKIIPQIVKKIASSLKSSFTKLAQSTAKQANAIKKKVSEKMDVLSEKVNKFLFDILKPGSPEALKNLKNITLKRIEMLNNGLVFSNAATSAISNICVANIQAKAYKAIAEFNMAMTDAEILRDLLATLLEKFTESQKELNVVAKMLSEQIEHRRQTGKYVAHQLQV